MNLMVSFISGVVMAWGLCISRMIDPKKVIGFLDIFGRWDPTLAFVMAGALLVSMISFRFILKREKPLCGECYTLPQKKEIDAPLVACAILFGIGWGLSGFCPAPAVASLAFGFPRSVIFVLSMFAGMILYQSILERQRGKQRGNKFYF